MEDVACRVSTDKYTTSSILDWCDWLATKLKNNPDVCVPVSRYPSELQITNGENKRKCNKNMPKKATMKKFNLEKENV